MTKGFGTVDHHEEPIGVSQLKSLLINNALIKIFPPDSEISDTPVNLNRIAFEILFASINLAQLSPEQQDELFGGESGGKIIDELSKNTSMDSQSLVVLILWQFIETVYKALEKKIGKIASIDSIEQFLGQIFDYGQRIPSILPGLLPGFNLDPKAPQFINTIAVIAHTILLRISGMKAFNTQE